MVAKKLPDKHTTDDNHQEHTKEHSSRRVNLYKSESNRMIAGICGGLGETFGIDPVIIRLVFVAFTLMGGSGILLYVLLWIILPSESQLTSGNAAMKENLEELKTRAQNFSTYFGGEDGKSWWGILLIALGVIYLLQNFGFSHIDWSRIWPLVLIIIGMSLLGRKRA